MLEYLKAVTLKLHATHHAVYLRLASLRQIYDIDSVVVEVFHAAVEVLPQKGARFTRQGDASKTQLSRKEKHKSSINTGYRHWSYIVTKRVVDVKKTKKKRNKMKFTFCSIIC